MIKIKNFNVTYTPKYYHDKYLKNKIVRFAQDIFLKQSKLKLSTTIKSNPVIALDIETLEINKGDKVGIIGGNGAGKTTLLNVIAGRIPSFNKSAITNIPFDNISFFIDLKEGFDSMATGYENAIIKFLHNKQFPTNSDLMQIKNFSELGDHFNRPISGYSSGMIMRLAFSIMCQLKKDIFVMDEWLSVGDKNFKLKANLKLREMVSNLSVLVIASHSEKLIKKVCNRVITLEKGKIISDVYI